MELTGHPRAILYCGSTASVAYLAVKLCDVAPDGSAALISKGGLNLTHREPESDPSPLQPGVIYEITVELQALSYVIAAGHRLRLMIDGADFQNAWPTPEPAWHTIHCGGRCPSRIVLPVAPQPEAETVRPTFQPSPYPIPPRETLARPEYVIERNLAAATTTVKYDMPVGPGFNRSDYTVSVKNPARTVIRSECEYQSIQGGAAFVVHAHSVTSSDEQAFHHQLAVNISMNGQPFWRKQWMKSAPRKLN